MSGFLRSTSIVGGYTLLSRVTGLLRDMVYSRMFGAGVLMDAFLVAFKIPNFMRRLFAEGAFSQAFVPVVSEYKVRSTHDEVRELVDGAAGTLASFLALVTVVGDRRGAAPRAAVRARVSRGGGEVRSHGRDAALDVPVPALHLARGARGRRAQQLRPVRRARVHLDAAQPDMIVFAAWIAPHFEQPGIALAIGVFVAGACSSRSRSRSCFGSGCCAGRAGAGITPACAGSAG